MTVPISLPRMITLGWTSWNLETLDWNSAGIIDVMSLYGASAVKDSSQVQLIVYLENYDTHKTFDRLKQCRGTQSFWRSHSFVFVFHKTGRNISVVTEAAAMNYRAKEMGFDATRLSDERLTSLIARNEVQNAWSNCYSIQGTLAILLVCLMYCDRLDSCGLFDYERSTPRKKIIPDDILDFILVALPWLYFRARLYLCYFLIWLIGQNL